MSFDTIKHIKNLLCLKNDSFPKKVRYGTVWCEFFENSRESLYCVICYDLYYKIIFLC